MAVGNIVLFSSTSKQIEFNGGSPHLVYYISNTIPENYGFLYNNYVATTTFNVANTGWKVPSFSEWTVTLATYIGGYPTTVGGAMKETGTTYWNAPNTGATNSSGFSARGSGNRSPSGSFLFNKVGTQWWTSDVTNNTVAITAASATISAGNADVKYGMSLRLIKTTTTSATDGTIITNGYTGNDGQRYDTIVINSREWLLRNLKETYYRGGTIPIPELTDNTAWANDSSGARCFYII
jgi:uncharacterized protein (TIGR02145 family)